MSKKKPKFDISRLTDYELEQIYNDISNQIKDLDFDLSTIEQEMRYREKPYIKTKLGFKTPTK